MYTCVALKKNFRSSFILVGVECVGSPVALKKGFQANAVVPIKGITFSLCLSSSQFSLSPPQLSISTILNLDGHIRHNLPNLMSSFLLGLRKIKFCGDVYLWDKNFNHVDGVRMSTDTGSKICLNNLTPNLSLIILLQRSSLFP